MSTIGFTETISKIDKTIEEYNKKVRHNPNNPNEFVLNNLIDLRGKTLGKIHKILSNQVNFITDYVELYDYNIDEALALIESIPNYETTILDFS